MFQHELYRDDAVVVDESFCSPELASKSDLLNISLALQHLCTYPSYYCT